MVRLKIKRSTPRLVLKTEPALVPPKALPKPAPRTWSRMKLMTATQSIICTIRIAGSHWAKICSSLSCSPICFLRDYIILRKPGRKVVTCSLLYEFIFFYAPSHDKPNTKQRNAADCNGRVYSSQHGWYAAASLQNAVRRRGR